MLLRLMDKHIYFNMFSLCAAGIIACLYVLRVSAADLFGNGKNPCPELSATKQEREGNDISQSLSSSGSEYMKNSQ